MSEFNTHGGYFAPKDYMKVEAGGSHEENPNGGVQIGVDQQGTPNLLEEGEPVYKDYVYSDNIKASERFLKENNIPEKYAGELYSKIADSFFSEAENRPNDPISRNGLEAMLGRLADAQEGQKAYNEQRKLKKELASLSPDELAALEEMLATGEQQQMQAEPMPQEGMVPEQMPEQPMGQPLEQPMMRNGGRLFEAGGDTDGDEDIVKEAVRQAYRERELEENDLLEERLRRATNVTSWIPGAPGLLSMAGNMLLSGEGRVPEAAGVQASVGLLARPDAETLKRGLERRTEYEVAKNAAAQKLDVATKHVARASQRVKDSIDGYDVAKRELEAGIRSGASAKEIEQLSKTYDEAAAKIPKARAARNKAVAKQVEKRAAKAATILKHPNAGAAVLGGAGIVGLVTSPFADKALEKNRRTSIQNAAREAVLPQIDSTAVPVDDGLIHLDEGSRRLEKYGGPINRFDEGSQIRLPDTYVYGEDKRKLAQFSNLATQMYPNGLVRNTSPISFEDLARRVYGNSLGIDWSSYEVPTTEVDVDETLPTSVKTHETNPYLSTLPRYAGAIGSGLLGLYNAFQKPDKYTATRYKPFTPSGRINLQDQRYNPVDQNMLMSQVLAQGNSSQRAVRNSGIGPSTAAALIAQDANTTGNLGNTFLQAWDANNQRRNQVIAANNQNEAQRAQFDYAIDAARQKALADAQMRNAYTDLQLQQLNYAAEGDKYAAISNQISNALQALSGIGQENFAMNQVNSNPANEGYGVLGGGVGAYLPYYYRRNYKCGGKKK